MILCFQCIMICFLSTNQDKHPHITHLLQPLKVLSEEGYGPLWPGGAQLDDAVLQQLLNVVFLHVLLALSQAPLLLAARTSRRHDDNRKPCSVTSNLWTMRQEIGTRGGG